MPFCQPKLTICSVVPCPKCGHCRNTKELFQECLNAEDDDEDDEDEEDGVEDAGEAPTAPQPVGEWDADAEAPAVGHVMSDRGREWALQGLHRLSGGQVSQWSGMDPRAFIDMPEGSEGPDVSLGLMPLQPQSDQKLRSGRSQEQSNKRS